MGVFKLEQGKSYKTRGGATARVICSNLLGEAPFAVAITDRADGTEFIYQYNSDGTCSKGYTSLDIMPPKRKIWIGVFEYNKDQIHCFPYDSLEAVDNSPLSSSSSDPHYRLLKKIEVEID